MNQSLSARIQEKMSGFSKGQRLIAKYIEEHYDKVAFMTASRLGATVGVSESTVVRFATEIGYAGYPDLQQAMQAMIRNKLTSVQRMEVTADRIGDSDVLESVLNHDIELIRRTMEETPHEDFYHAVDAIVESRNIYILGVRSSQSLASFLAYYFSLIFENVKQVNASSEAEIFEQMLRVNEHDTVIGISFPRYSKKAVKALQFASKRGARVIALTDSAVSPIAEPADYVLLAKSDMASIVDSLVAPLSMINALVVTTALKKRDEVTKVFSSLENIWEDYGVYEKVDGHTN